LNQTRSNPAESTTALPDMPALALLFADIDATVARALAEDIGDGDVSAALVPAGRLATARVITRDAAVVCGRPWVDEVVKQVDSTLDLEWEVADGQAVEPGTTLFTIMGNARSLLTAERTMLNFLQLLSGTATATAHLVRVLEGTRTRLLDTRKTLPGLRCAQKYAVYIGGGTNHRIGLFDAYLIKENHIAAAGGITAAVHAARQARPDLRVEVEVETMAQLDEALAAGAEMIMLDNFDVPRTREAVLRTDGRAQLEASGGIDGDQLRQVAETGVDFISVGALTKHVRAIDLSMRLHLGMQGD
jgi:nicotinate-nucleotide pyrophosphorylase (carboxylating)